MIAPTNKTRPIRVVGWVCVDCGSVTPESPTDVCSHQSSVRLSGWRESITDRLAAMRDTMRQLEAARAAFGELVDIEVAAGRAMRVQHGAVTVASNVQFVGCDSGTDRPRFCGADGAVRETPLPREADGRLSTPMEPPPAWGRSAAVLQLVQPSQTPAEPAAEPEPLGREEVLEQLATIQRKLKAPSKHRKQHVPMRLDELGQVTLA